MEKSLNKIECFILAAGMSKRMGKVNKLLKIVNDKTIINHTLTNHSESNIDNIKLIVGYEKNLILDSIINLKFSIIENNNYEDGMLSSILAISENIDHNTSGIIISLADMPYVSSNDINKLIKVFNENNQKIICIPEYSGKLGNPLLLPVEIYKSLVNEKDKLSKDKGLKNIILEKKYNYKRVSLSEGVTIDFDTEDDFSL